MIAPLHCSLDDRARLSLGGGEKQGPFLCQLGLHRRTNPPLSEPVVYSFLMAPGVQTTCTPEVHSATYLAIEGTQVLGTRYRFILGSFAFFIIQSGRWERSCSPSAVEVWPGPAAHRLSLFSTGKKASSCVFSVHIHLPIVTPQPQTGIYSSASPESWRPLHQPISSWASVWVLTAARLTGRLAVGSGEPPSFPQHLPTPEGDDFTAGAS